MQSYNNKNKHTYIHKFIINGFPIGACIAYKQIFVGQTTNKTINMKSF